MYKENDYKLNIEKLCDVLKVDYPHFFYIIIFVIISINLFYDYMTYQLSGSVLSIAEREYYIKQALIWSMPYLFENIVAIYFILKVRREIIETLNTLQNYLQNDDDITNLLNRSFNGNINT